MNEILSRGDEGIQSIGRNKKHKTTEPLKDFEINSRKSRHRGSKTMRSNKTENVINQFE